MDEPTTSDAIRDDLLRALERQLATLLPVAHDVHAAAAHPPLAPNDWRGTAADAYAVLESVLRTRLADADHAVTDAVRGTRAAIARLGV